MGTARVLLGFAQAADHDLEETAGEVIKGLTGNSAYPSLPVPLSDVQTKLTAFTTAIAAQAQGGTVATAVKDDKREALIGDLRRLAGYVQQASQGDLAVLLSSGFEAVSTNRAQTELETPGIRAIENGQSGQLVLRVDPIRNARCYEARQAAVVNGQTSPWVSSGIFTQARRMVIPGLTPGTMYTFAVRAVGGSTDFSGWSDPVSHMSL